MKLRGGDAAIGVNCGDVYARTMVPAKDFIDRRHSVSDMLEVHREYHGEKISEIREDQASG